VYRVTRGDARVYGRVAWYRRVPVGKADDAAATASAVGEESRVDLFTISEYATKAKHAECDEGPVPINQTWVLHATNRPSWWIRSGAHPNARRCT
jgi:hypothetical protein